MNSVIVTKLLIYLTNITFLGFGCYLMYVGVCLASDEEFVSYGWLLPSKFAMPMFYYTMFGVTLLGVLFCGLSLLGCASAYTGSRLLLSLYVFSLAATLIAETAGLISSSVTPDFLGLEVDPDQLTDSWQRFYAVPGKEHLTAAIDFIQTKAECCGPVRSKDWTTSWWRLREYGPEELRVPLSCCVRNSTGAEEFDSYLDPRPVDVSSCQNEEEEVYSSARHTQGCAIRLHEWLQKWLRQALYLSLSAIFYQLLLLLTAICGAVQIFSKA